VNVALPPMMEPFSPSVEEKVPPVTLQSIWDKSAA
jgi:hypothetical protein